MYQQDVKIIFNRKIKGRFFHCAFLSPQIAKDALPGQFINIKVSDTLVPLLRRPLGIHRVQSGKVEVLYEVLGQATEALSLQKAGGRLNVLGPLGKGFECKPQASSRRPQILVAGGMGVAPLLFLAKRIVSHKSQVTSHKLVVLIGARTKSQVLCEQEFRALGCEVKIATDDGSQGFKGRITQLLEEVLITRSVRKPPRRGPGCQVSSHRVTSCRLQAAAAVYACGPKPMLKEIARLSKERGFTAQVSLEEHMSCGFGACMGCAVKVRPQATSCKPQGSGRKVTTSQVTSEYVRVCKEGPVFNADEILWE